MAEPILAQKKTLSKEQYDKFVWTGAIICERIEILKAFIWSHADYKRIILSEPFQSLMSQRDKWENLIIANDKELSL